ncbi:unnamed protein product [Merluccius merluccius]
MAHIRSVQKKTSTMSLTISSSSSSAAVSSRELTSSTSNCSSSSSSFLNQRHSDLLQTLPVSPQTTQSPLSSQPFSANGVAPTFVKCLHDVSTLKGKLVVLECRLRGTPPLQVMWYREDEHILDSDDFRILRKNLQSTDTSCSLPWAAEELCTLVITEAFPEDSGLFKCMAVNPFGSVSCSALLEVYNDVEEQLESEFALGQEKEAAFLPPPPPDWPDNSDAEDVPTPNVVDFPEPLPQDNHSAQEPFLRSAEESLLSSEGQRSPEDTPQTRSPTPPPPPPPPSSTQAPVSKIFTPSKLSFNSSSQPGSDSMNLSDLPTFKPSAFPPSGFNYERPRHFIQSQPSFQAPSYESSQSLPPSSPNQANCSQANGTSKSSPSSSGLSSPTSTPASSAALPPPLPPSCSVSAPPPPSPSSFLPSPTSPSGFLPCPTSPSSTILSAPLPRMPMRSTITLTPSVPSATGLGSATLPANPDARAYLCSVLPSQPTSSAFSKLTPPGSGLPHSPTRSPLPTSSPLLPTRHANAQQLPCATPFSPIVSAPPQAPPPAMTQNRVTPTVVSLPSSYKGTPAVLPKPILKKPLPPPPRPSSRSTDEDIQGSKDALIQDLEKKLRSKEARRRSNQKLSYEERMARRLLGPDNASYMFDQDNFADGQSDQLDYPEGRHTGGLWGKHHSGTDERGAGEGSAIQEKCYLPRFLQIPSDLTVEEGRFCRIDFKVGGLPSPDVAWYLDGKAIRPDDYHKMLVCEKGMHSFIIEIVTVHHAGVYECVAHNRAGESRFTMRLDVIAQELLRPPTFTQKMQNSRAVEGDTVRMECKVDASPPPQLFWKKDKDMLRVDPNRMSLYQDGSGRQCLLIERLTKADAGWYTLSAINEAGMSTCNARLDVGTRTTPAMKTAPPGSKTLKLLTSLSHLTPPAAAPPAQHTAPLYESEEL